MNSPKELEIKPDFENRLRVELREFAMQQLALLGSGRTMNTGWIAATEIFPPFRQKFKITADPNWAVPGRLHPRLPEWVVGTCKRAGWIDAWLSSLPEASMAALDTFFRREPRPTITDREAYRRIGDFAGGKPDGIRTAFHELIAMAKLLEKSVEETNPYHIHTSFHCVRYQEGKNSFELTIDPGESDSWVYVPAPEQWARQVPPWAAGRRDEIVARLRAHLGAGFKFVAG